MSTLKSNSAEEFVAAIGELPALGPVTAELLVLLDQENASPRKILRLLAQDPMLAAKVVRMANSSFYGGMSAPNLDQALVRIGLREVRNVVLTSSVVKIFPDLGPGFDLSAYWLHCIASGIAAHRVAQNAPALKQVRPNAEGFYVCGLLHHLGIFLHAQYLGAELKSALDLCEREGLPLYVAEGRVLGFDHAESAACLLERWGFDPEVRAAVRFHHQPEEAADEHQTAARVLHVSAMLCHSIQGEKASFEGHLEGFDERAWFGLGFDSDSMEPMHQQVADSVKTAKQLVGELFP